MLRKFANLFVLFFVSWGAPSVGQVGNVKYVLGFDGADLGEKITNAAAACNTDTTINCLLVLDPILATWPEGALPTLASHIAIVDLRTPGGVGLGSFNHTLYVDGVQFPKTAAGLQAAIDKAVSDGDVTRIVIPGSINIGTTTVTMTGIDHLYLLQLGGKLIYTGNGVALDISDDARNDRSMVVENVKIDLSGAGINAIAFRATRVEGLKIINPFCFGPSGTGASRCIQILGDGTVDANDYYSAHVQIINPTVTGNFTVGIEGDSIDTEGSVNSSQIFGGIVNRTTPGVAGEIGINLTSKANTWSVYGTNVEKYDVGIKNDGNQNTFLPGRMEANSTSEFAFGSNSTRGMLINPSLSAKGKIAWSGSGNGYLGSVEGVAGDQEFGWGLTEDTFRIKRRVNGSLTLKLDTRDASDTNITFSQNNVDLWHILSDEVRWALNEEGIGDWIQANTKTNHLHINSDGSGPISFNETVGSGTGDIEIWRGGVMPTLEGTITRDADVTMRRYFTNGTPLGAGDFGFETTGEWGDTADPSVGSIRGTDQWFEFVMTAGGANTGANPDIRITFTDGTWTTAPIALCNRQDFNTPATATVTVSSVTATVLTLVFDGTPTATNTYKFACMVGGI